MLQRSKTEMCTSKGHHIGQSQNIFHSFTCQSSRANKMTNIPLSSMGSSVFDLGHLDHHPHGSSLTSFAWKPNHDDHHGHRRKRIAYENTYRLDPPAKFRADKVKPIIEKVLASNLDGRKYDAIECTLLCKSLSEEIKTKVKELHFQRYKLLSVVTIGQKNDQGVSVGSRFLWDSDRDNFATSSWSNREMYAVGTVYALYYE